MKVKGSNNGLMTAWIMTFEITATSDALLPIYYIHEHEVIMPACIFRWRGKISILPYLPSSPLFHFHHLSYGIV
jgi:hypothetical protein